MIIRAVGSGNAPCSRRACFCLASLAIGFPGLADESADAVQLYERGRYADALPILQKLDQEGRASGPMLYRLYYCQQAGGDAAAARASLARAQEKLEAELVSAPSLEVAFYLANVHSNAGRLSDKARVSLEATSKIEAGDWAEPTDGTAYFQLAKLYADQQNDVEAAMWYAEAVTALEGDNDASPAYAQWASRYLGQQANDEADFDAVDRYYGLLLDQGVATAEELDKLGISRVRLGKYREAGAAWRKAVLANPAQSNHPRYCAALTDRARDLKQVPVEAPDGRPLYDHDRAELEGLLLAAAGKVRDVKTEAAEFEELDREQRKAFQARLDSARAEFVAAGLEYAVRGYPIRETAFQSGYATLVFRPDDWRMPQPPRGR